MPAWPPWWDYELELSPHLLKRMTDRGFTETDLRDMLQRATGYRPDDTAGRFAINTTLAGRPWRVIVEPEDGAQLLVVITAYAVA